MTAQALINPKILTWARARAGFSEDLLAHKANVAIEKVIAWENGTDKPTFIQAQKLANAMHTPFGYFFLSEPPYEKLLIPDLRTVGSRAIREVSPELREIVKDITLKQEWYKEYLKAQGEKDLPFVASFKSSDRVTDVVQDIKRTLNINLPIEGSWDDYQKKIISAAENAGILVMRSGVVANNNKRKINVNEVRGFAISDPMAPVIYINSSDAPPARLFTLIHELAHIWIGSSGISDITNHHSKEESFCNQVAGEFLVPKKEFNETWNFDQAFDENLRAIAVKFHVSTLVAAKRAFDLNVITKEMYNQFYEEAITKFKNTKSGGGSYYSTVKAKNGALLSNAVVTEALSGRLLLRDAGRLLNIQPSKITTFASKLTS